MSTTAIAGDRAGASAPAGALSPPAGRIGPGSAIYEGWVSHHRREPIEHGFRYPIFMPLVDLDELPGLFDRIPLWSARRRAPARYRRSDYLRGHGDGLPLADAARELVAERTDSRPGGPVLMLSNPRYWGVGFNPVSFYFAYEHDGAIAAMIAEVTNTPWGERHAYVMDPAGGGSDKAFHVSPFMGMDHRYSWRLTPPADTLAISITSDRAGERVFDAALRLDRRPLTRGALTHVLVRHPAAGLVTLARIYGQALRLKRKGAPYFPHPDTTTPEPSR